MLTTEIRDKFMAAIKEGTTELTKMQNGTHEIQEVLDELNRVLGLTIIVQDGYLYAGDAKMFAFKPTDKGYPVYCNLLSTNLFLKSQAEIIYAFECGLKTPSIVKLIREQQNAK